MASEPDSAVTACVSEKESALEDLPFVYHDNDIRGSTASPADAILYVQSCLSHGQAEKIRESEYEIRSVHPRSDGRGLRVHLDVA